MVQRYLDAGCTYKRKTSDRPSMSAETIDRFRQAYQRSPRKSIRRLRSELNVTQPNVLKILRKRPALWLYYCKCKVRIWTAITKFDQTLLKNVWHEAEYGLNVCRATNGAQIELSWGMEKNSELLFKMVEFNFCMAINFLLINLCKRSHHLYSYCTALSLCSLLVHRPYYPVTELLFLFQKPRQ
jgi:hypothetical protein